MLAVLQRRFPLLAVDIVPVTVQGEHAVPQIVRALQALDRAGDHDVVLLAARGLDAIAGDPDRVSRAVAGLGRVDRGARLLGDDLQLVHGVRALQVGGDEERGVAVFLELLGELSRAPRM